MHTKLRTPKKLLGVCLCLLFSVLPAISQVSADQKCLAEAIYREAGGESLKGQIAVGEVIMNRVNAGIAPSVCGVTHQHVGGHWQFGFNVLGRNDIPHERKEFFYTLAQDVIDGTIDNPFPPEVLYFNNTPFDPARYQLYMTIGKQHFYSKKESAPKSHKR